MNRKKLIANSEFWHVVEKVYDFVLCFEISSGNILRKYGFDKVCTTLDAHTNYYDLIDEYRSSYVNDLSKAEFYEKTSTDFLITHELVKFMGLENVENNEMRWYEYTIVIEGNIGTMLIHDIHDMHCKMLELEDRTKRDYLTNAINRYTFDEIIDEKMERSKEFAILFIDIDDFKYINDNYGHLTGDMVLKEAVKLIENFLPDTSIVARYGGDEFIVCIDDVSEMKSIEKYMINIMDAAKDELKCGVTVSFSIGVSFYPKDGEDRKKIFHSADIALYNAKRKGKKTYEAADNL